MNHGTSYHITSSQHELFPVVSRLYLTCFFTVSNVNEMSSCVYLLSDKV